MRDFHVTVLAALLLVSPALAQKRDKNHNDAFVNGTPDESRIAKEVRHQLVTLPFFGVFDDLAVRVEGGTVTLLGAVTQPVLKSDAAKV
jgi:hyperosmotically inducible protein